MRLRAALAVAFLTATPFSVLAQSGNASAEPAEICKPVRNGFGVPVTNGFDKFVTSAASHECPAEVPVATPAAAPVSAPAPAPKPVEIFTLSADVGFDFDQAVLRPEALRLLDGAAAKILAQPNARIQVKGHTDSKGTDAYNQGLSERRAMAVAAYLNARGVPVERMAVTGFGESSPIATNETDAGRAQNRRVEIFAE